MQYQYVIYTYTARVFGTVFRSVQTAAGEREARAMALFSKCVRRSSIYRAASVQTSCCLCLLVKSVARDSSVAAMYMLGSSGRGFPGHRPRPLIPALHSNYPATRVARPTAMTSYIPGVGMSHFIPTNQIALSQHQQLPQISKSTTCHDSTYLPLPPSPLLPPSLLPLPHSLTCSVLPGQTYTTRPLTFQWLTEECVQLCREQPFGECV